MLSAGDSAGTSALFGAALRWAVAMANPRLGLLVLRVLVPIIVAASIAACGFDPHPKSEAVACRPQNAACCPEGYICVGRGAPADGGVSPGSCWYKEDLPPSALAGVHDYTPAIPYDPGCIVTDWLPPGTGDAGGALDGDSGAAVQAPDTAWTDLVGGGHDSGADAPLGGDTAIGAPPDTRSEAPSDNIGVAVDGSAVDGGVSRDSAAERMAETAVDGGNACDGAAAEVSRDQSLATEAGGIDAPPIVVGIVSSISAGAGNTCAVVRGAVLCWGSGAEGKLGYDTLSNKVPTQVPGLGSGATVVTTGETHTCAVVNSGVKCWGRNFYGQLGDNTTSMSLSPVQVVGLEAGVTDVCGGGDHTCAIVEDNVWCWGLNTYGELGDGTLVDRHVPVPVSGLPSPVTALACGGAHTCAIADGRVYCWGNNSEGQVDFKNAERPFQPTPFRVGSLTSVAWAVAAGGQASCAVINGGAMCWGDDQQGTLGYGELVNPAPTYPVRVAGLSAGVTDISISEVGLGCAIVNGGVQCWGGGEMSPFSVISANSGIIALSVGIAHFCVTTVDKMMCWGDNAFGQMGDGTEWNYRSTPVTVLFP